MSFDLFKVFYLVFFLVLGLAAVVIHSAALLALFLFGMFAFIATIELLNT